MSQHNILLEAQHRIENNERIDFELAELLVEQGNLNQLQTVANFARQKRVGDKVYFINNYHLYYTNICIWRCKFCAFSRNPGEADAYTKTIDDITAELKSLSPNIAEIRVTGGVNPQLGLEYYEDLISCIKSKVPHAHIEAFAPTEITFISRKSKLPAKQVLLRLKNAGLGSLTSGGAEIFNPELRKKLCPKKSSIESWLNISKTAHNMGIPSNASILFGHMETYTDWLQHLFTLRKLQDETGGFNSFVPLRFLPQNTQLTSYVPADFSEVLRMIAISRIVLDNFKSIKFLWIYYGSQHAKEALNFGANDLAGTACEKYKGVARSANSGSEGRIAQDELINIIKESKRIPVEREKLFEERHVYH